MMTRRRPRCGTAAGPVTMAKAAPPPPPQPKIDEAARVAFNSQCSVAGEALGLTIGRLQAAGLTPHALLAALLGSALVYAKAADREAALLLTKAALEGLLKDLSQ